MLKVGQEIEVRPGLVSKDSEGKLTCKPIRSKIVSLFAEQNDLMYAVPGGLIGVGTKVSQKRNICKHLIEVKYIRKYRFHHIAV